MPLELKAEGMRDPTGFMVNIIKLLALIKRSGEGGGGGGLLSCTNLGTGTSMEVLQFLKN